MRKLSEFGFAVKTKLMLTGKTQLWLIDEVKKDTGLYVDKFYLWKILVGEKRPEKIINSIKKILELE